MVVTNRLSLKISLGTAHARARLDMADGEVLISRAGSQPRRESSLPSGPVFLAWGWGLSAVLDYFLQFGFSNHCATAYFRALQLPLAQPSMNRPLADAPESPRGFFNRK